MFVWVVFSHPLALPRMSWESWVESGKPPPPPFLLSHLSLAPAVTAPFSAVVGVVVVVEGVEGVGVIIEGQRLPELTEIFFSDQSHFLSLPTPPSPPHAVCLVCAGGV